jgi:hypothetical protein
MTVWVVGFGSYSDYHVVGVYSSEELADKAAECDPDHLIEEIELDAPSDHEHPAGMKRFAVHMTRDGGIDLLQVNIAHDIFGEGPSAPGTPREVWVFYMWARDEEHAIKIANERRAMVIATNMWDAPWADVCKWIEAKSGEAA